MNTSTKWNKRVFCFSILLLIFVPTVHAQAVENSASQTPAAPDLTNQANPAPPIAIGNSQLKDLELSPTERLLRSWQYQYQLQEQPAFIVASSGGTTQTIPNPDKWLQQHSIILTLSELFPRTGNLPGLVQAAYDNSDHTNNPRMKLGPDLCPSDNTMQCLAGGGSYWGRSFWGRLFSGASLTFSVAQRDEVQQGVVVPNLTTSQGWGWNGEVKFDPASLFITSVNWKSAVSVLGKGPDGKYRYIGAENLVENSAKNPSDEFKCLVQVPTDATAIPFDKCEKQFARPRLNPSIQQNFLTSLAAIVTPTFDLKVQSQFDFIKQGGILIQSPLLQRSLKNMTFTWDLRRLIPATTDKLTIATLYEQAKITSKPSDSTSSKLCVLRSGAFRSYITVAPGSTTISCKRLAIDLDAKEYAVACATDQKVGIGNFVRKENDTLDSDKPSTICGW